jgi:hypothetical protein
MSSIEFSVCHWCKCVFCDEVPHPTCSCPNHWCSQDCAKKDEWKVNTEGTGPVGSAGCAFCRGEDDEDYFLLLYALKRMGMTRKQLFGERKQQQSYEAAQLKHNASFAYNWESK